jgi:hypothetical protein
VIQAARWRFHGQAIFLIAGTGIAEGLVDRAEVYGAPREYAINSGDRQLRGLPFFDDLPEIRCQLAIVTSKPLMEGPLGPVRRLPSPLVPTAVREVIRAKAATACHGDCAGSGATPDSLVEARRSNRSS